MPSKPTPGAPRLYDFFFDRVLPLVSREMRFGGRRDQRGMAKYWNSRRISELARLREAVGRVQPQAIAPFFSHSRIRRTRRRSPQQSPKWENLFCLSPNSPRVPRIRTHQHGCGERLFATAHAELPERIGERVSDLSGASRGARIATRIFVMQSSGGSPLWKRQRNRADGASGPAGGLVGAAAMASRSGFPRVLSFDMGGTSTDVALVEGEARPGSQAEVAGFPVGVPMLDIHTVGAGGGSLARFDAGGALRVGPESAGADPGPICYGRGVQPTVTDANLILGRLRPDRFLGGEFTLDVERTRRLTTQWLKKQNSRLTLEQFAAGVLQVVNANMERALRVAIERADTIHGSLPWSPLAERAAYTPANWRSPRSRP